MKEEVIKSVLMGLAVGDALGVPVEFRTREFLEENPVKEMTGYGSWDQPAGTWSDDSSLAFCLAQSLTKTYDLNDIAQNFIQWLTFGYWGAHNKVFDVGGATRFAIGRLMKGISPLLSGGMFEEDNGNGSLMRIAPLLFHIKNLTITERYNKIKEVSSITHGHFRSVFACFIYMEFALGILNEKTPEVAYNEMQAGINDFAAANEFNQEELDLFKRILKGNIKDEKKNTIISGGYVLHTLEASIWCILNSKNYSEAVLKAVNLGGDTDTTGCVTGAVAGLLYGYDNIPNSWIDVLARKDEIKRLSKDLYASASNQTI
jgi:ADP-ribosyl-[dinitrogen reductase] hydrolase